ncbi:MAG: RdgB/HAM1 family non-canonical purine NTP pyrophosphatase [Desulfuromonas thiophila]|nr:RdgB/HAM1 family non-canonical purine NTP pyrophosphatase [Desulfuromonas thiophila]
MKLLVATGNAGKLREICQALEGMDIRVEGLVDHPGLQVAQEDGDSFAANAIKKALTIARQAGCLCLADDSGLEVAALAGAPGVYSARFAGPQATDADNNALLLARLAGVPAGQRQAAFRCLMALCDAAGRCRLFEGRLDGEILTRPLGAGGFGYDPLFWLPGQNCSLAQLDLAAKNRISHRGQALAALLAALRQGGDPLSQQELPQQTG